MKNFFLFIFLLFIIGVPAYIYTSPVFERETPNIKIKHSKFWNPKNDLKIEINDKSGLRYYKVTIINGGNAYIMSKMETPSMDKNVTIDLKIPKQYPISGDTIKVIVEAVDNSKWNFFAGNEIRKEFDFTIDTTFPEVEVINNSYAIGRGGSAVAIVKVKDNNLKNAYIEVNGNKKFKLTQFYKDNYYISLLAWNYNDKNFRAYLIAEDKAGNISKTKIPYYYRKVRYRKVNINISDNFVENIDVRVLNNMGVMIPNNNKDIFLKTNREVRKMNEKALYNASNVVLEDKVDYFTILPFKPMKGAAKKADYGEVRSYIYNGKKIDETVHKGLDLASFRHARVYNSNKGMVIYRKYTGIYGNTLLIYHGLGLVSGYSHLSEFRVNENKKVFRGDVIALTGSTGAVFGDHLHFSIQIQGVVVNPIEWMDKNWIKLNITNVINKAKIILNR